MLALLGMTVLFTRHSPMRHIFRLPWRTARQIDDDVEEELRFHLDMRAQELVAKGIVPAAALDEARRQFGDLEYTKHYCRHIDVDHARRVRRTELFSDLGQDVAYALRTLRRTPAFTAVAVLTLALGIGANTAIFSVVNCVLLKPLPYPEPDRLVRVFSTFPGGRMPVSPADLADWRARSHSFRGLSAITNMPTTITGDGADPERLNGVASSTNLFDVLSVRPILGRAFTPGPDVGDRGERREAILSEALWKRRFAADPRIVGKSILLDDVPHTVVGVVPSAQVFPVGTDIWTPLHLPRALITEPGARNANFQRVLGRLQPGVSVEQARAEMETIARQLGEQYPMTNKSTGADVAGLHELMVGDLRKPLVVLLAAVALVLLIASANVANLLLARASARRHELAIRTAIGAGRSRIVRQLLTESVILALCGATAGLGLAAWGTTRLASLARDRLPRLEEIGVDHTVLLVTLAVAMFTGVLFGIVPAFLGSRLDLGRTLRESGARGSAGTATRSGGGRAFQRLLAAGEVALALMLLASAGLLIESFVKLRRIDPGFHTDGVVTFDLSLRQRRVGPDQRESVRIQVVSTLVDRLSAVQGVHAAAVVSGLPMSGATFILPFDVAGRPKQAGQQLASELRAITDRYFEVVGIPLRRGRGFTRADGVGAPRVLVLSEGAARRFFPNEEPLGKRISIQSDSGYREIVGVVGDVRGFGLAQEPEPQIYLPFAQGPMGDFDVVLQTSQRPAQLQPLVRQLVRDVSPDTPVRQIRSFDELVMDSVAQQRLYMLLLGLFASVALTLAAVGIYGVLSYGVSQRVREIGVRMALGATMTNVVGLVLRDGLVLTAAGLAAGVVGALSATRLLRGLLHGVSPTDPLAFTAGVIVLGIVGAIACYLPARRAARVDPAVTMRGEV